MPKTSAGFLLYRLRGGELQVLIGHMGGPFWARKETGAWSIPKGEYTDEDPLLTARREFEEELGQPVPVGDPEDLGSFRQSGKVVRIWALEGDLDPTECRSNVVEVEWPPHSGRRVEVPEIDRVEWVAVPDAGHRLVRGQVPALEALAARVAARRRSPNQVSGATAPTRQRAARRGSP